MREQVFVQQRQKRWREIEGDLKSLRKTDPDRLAEDYIELTDDLAIATAQFPQSRTAAYLHRIAASAHAAVVRNKRSRLSRIIEWWTYTVPITLVRLRPHMLFSASIFLIVGLATGTASVFNEDVIRNILGVYYVDMTLDNILEGKPMGVYQSQDAWIMFVSIAWNNVTVVIAMIVFGLLPYIGTGVHVLRNATMIGAFHGLFIANNAFSEFVLGVYIHGAVEITCIIIAGAAGFAVGDGILFPRTYSRKVAFTRALRVALRTCAALLPFILVAAALESFVTRHAAVSPMVNALIILLSFAAIGYYFFTLPSLLVKRYESEPTLH